MKGRKTALKNRILAIFGAALVIALSLVSIRSAFVSTVALEQAARCGAAEHHHTAACYRDGRVSCGQTEHTHNRNCYLVLLRDNDINNLLSHLDSDKNRSLEMLIYRTVDSAIRYNEDLYDANKVAAGGDSLFAPIPAASQTPSASPSPEVSAAVPEAPTQSAPVEPTSSAPVPMQEMDISELNETIDENQIEPNIVLNENLYNAAAFANAPGDTVLMITPTAGSGGVSTLAVGDSQSTKQNTANIYVNLDNEWVCIGNVPVTRESVSITRYNITVSTAAVTNLINSSLGTSYTYSNYRVEYSDNGQKWTSATPGRETIQIGSRLSATNAAKTRHIRIMNSQGGDLKFYTVTFEYTSGGVVSNRVVRYVLANQYVDIPEGEWESSDGNTYYGGDSAEITAPTTFRLKDKYTVTYRHADGTTTSETVTGGTQITLPTTLPADYRWTANGVIYRGGDRVTVNNDIAFTVVAPYTVTYRYPNGTTSTLSVPAGGQVTLPAGHTWNANGTTYNSGTQVTINGDITFTGTAHCVVTYQYPDGRTSTETVPAGGQITLPAGFSWTINGTSYDGGDRVTIRSDTTCIGTPEPIRVSYAVNFPTSNYGVSGVTRPSSTPTVEGMSGSSGTVNAEYPQGTTVRTVSQTMVNLTASHGTYKNYRYPVLFRGWESETGELISAHSQLSWQELGAYDANHDGTVTLTGVWDHELKTTLSFFVLLNSTTDQMASSDPSDYTDIIFSTYIGNADSGKLGKNPYKASNDTQARENDTKIRAMHGEQADSIWLYTFPKDEDVFEALKSYAQGRQLKVGDETVAVEDLNDNEYAIRWFKLIYENDGWHIDGKLTRKVGAIEVTKTFAGNDTLIDGAKSNFYITATNGSRTVRLSSANDVDDADGNPNTWMWRIDDVKYNEVWTLTESPNTGSNVIHHAEWSISDASADSQTSNGTGNEVTVRGVTYASDLADPEWLNVGFNNIYYHKDSLMIKKADGVTGEALGGAQFRLYQNDVLLTFDYDTSSGMYVYNAAGTGTYDTLTGNGYMNIAAKDFSYDRGPITVREITAPTNYNPVGDIKVGYLDSAQTTVGIIEEVDFATYEDGLLIVYNSANTMSVTAEKVWECGENEWKDVTVQLFANGSANLAATLSGAQSTVATLTAANDYSYTWTGLPIYAYGAKVDWSLRELQIGTEECKADYTFPNWAVSYDAAVHDADGNVTLKVHNTPKRPMLFLTKTNADGSAQLGGATFSLVQVSATGTPVSGFVTRTATTNEQGLLIFDNLLYGVRYRIVEETPPPAYRPLNSPIYVTIAEGGAVMVEPHSNARADAVAYNLVVTNTLLPTLPGTGGVGPEISYGLGGAMMLLAVCGYMLLDSRRKGRRQSG